jgi:hypothetical protein
MKKYFFKKSACIIGLLSLLSSIANTQTMEYPCPTTINSLQSKVDTWKVILVDHTPRPTKNKPSLRLYRVGLYDEGPDGNMGELLPDNEEELGGGVKKKPLWTFAPEDAFRHWVACSYYDTDLIARQILPTSVKSCEEIDELLPNQKIKGIKIICEI